MSLIEKQTEPNQEFIFLPKKEIPYVSQILHSLETNGVHIYRSELPILRSDTDLTRRYLLFQAVRRIDVTGLVPNLIGKVQNSDEAMNYLVTVAQDQLNWIQDQNVDEANEVSDAIDNRRVTPRSIILLDKMWGNLIMNLKSIKGQGLTKEANEYRNNNEEMLNYLLSRFDNNINRLTNREYIFGRAGNLIEIKEELIVPKIDASFEPIVPEIFKRDSNSSSRYDSPAINFLKKVEIIGNDITRMLIGRYLSKIDEEVREKMRK
ncbi:MAG: hypothetical protein M1409_06260 [Actinobacteria bacterium]|nr:hypothetical protein [Actinomycetota bacterium]